MTILSSAYFPPIPWFTVALNAEELILDIHEHYIKQTWRNRCRIITANGIMDLVIPIKHSGNNTAVIDLLIDYSTNWQRVHFNAIRSAYGKSPFYEYYSDSVERMFSKKPTHLVDWNEISIELIRNALHLRLPYTYSKEYIEPDAGKTDWRSSLIPGELNLPAHTKYIQVFEERHGFHPNLSILDLMFCEGPDAIEILLHHKGD